MRVVLPDRVMSVLDLFKRVVDNRVGCIQSHGLHLSCMRLDISTTDDTLRVEKGLLHVDVLI